MTLTGQYTFFDLQFSTRYEDLSWCWRFLHHCSIDTCQLHVTVGSGLVHCLATEGHFTRLRQFVSSLSVDEYAVLYGNEKFIRAMIGLYVEEENYLGALCFLKNGRFTDKDETLIKTWDDIHYKINQSAKGRPLTCVDKYRVRKSYPPPPSICADGRRPSQGRIQTATPVLRSWLHQHQDRPCPTSEELQDLASQTQVSVQRIKAWFARARRTGLTKKRRGRPTGRRLPVNQ